MDELGNILEKYLECTVYKTGTKRRNKINWNKFIWFRGEEILFLRFYSVKLKKIK